MVATNVFIVFISLPYLTTADITRVDTYSAIEATAGEPISQLRVS